MLKTREKEWSDYSDELKTLRKDQQESYEAKIKTLNETNSSLSSQIEHPGSETFERHEEEIRRLSSINSELMKDMEVLKINEQKERIQRLQNQIVEQNEKIINIENDHDKLKLHYDKDINYLEEKVNALQTRNNIRKLTEEYDNALMVKMKIEAKSAQILLQAADHQIKGLVLEVQRLKGKLVLSESRILLLKCCCVSLQQNSANIDRKDQEVQTEVTFDLLSLDFLEDVNPSDLWTPVPEENIQENDKQTEQVDKISII